MQDQVRCFSGEILLRRLLYSGLEIMRHGVPLVRFSGERLQELMDIRAGKFSYDELLSRANDLSCELGSLRESSDLPESADLDAVNDLLLAVTEKWMKENAR